MVQYNTREETEITYRTHVLGGIAVAAIVTNIAARGQLESLPPLTTPAVFGSFVSAMIGSALPDIDQPTSTVGKTLPVVSRLMCGAFGHRGFCHSALFLALFYWLVAAVLPSMKFYAFMLCLGAASHLFFDMFNRPGVPLLWPFKIRFRLAKIKTESKFGTKRDNMQEKVFRAVVTGLDFLLILGMSAALLGV
jgi:inner membrane protein